MSAGPFLPNPQDLGIHRAQVMQQASCFQPVYETGSRYVNDHCFICSSNGDLHLFHITGKSGGGPYDAGNEDTFGHALSTDLKTWHAEPDVLAIDPASSFEPHHIFAPFIIQAFGRFNMFYAGINQQTMQESMCLAVSDDLQDWEKDPANPVFRPSRDWAEYAPGSGIWGCCRDPHVICHPRYGFILYFVAWIKNTRGRLVGIGAAVSENLKTWQDAGPVMIRERAEEYSTSSMESPCVIERDGRFFLFYKHRDETRLVISTNPLNFTDQEDAWFSPAHAAEIFEYRGDWFISSCSRDILDVRHLTTDRKRGLFLARLDWSVAVPKVSPF
jgi:hypothetical protein